VGLAEPSAAPPPSVSQAAEILILPGVANTLGAHGSRWRSDLNLRNPGTEPIEVRVFFLRTSSPNDLSSAPHHDYFLVAGETKEIRNILGSEISVSGTGALLVMASRVLFPNNPLGASVAASMRTATPNPFAPGDAGSSVFPAEPTSAVRQVVSTFRHEGVGEKGVRGAAGAVNLTRSAQTIKVEFLDETGTVLGTQDWHLPALSTVQQMAPVRMTPGSVRFARTEGTGSYVAYATTVDNTTNEAVFVYASPEPGQAAVPSRMNAPDLLD
jgi:hypothetical protein